MKSSEQTLIELFIDNYNVIVEISDGNRQSSLGYPLDPKCDELTVKGIIQGRFYLQKGICFSPASTSEIYNIVKSKKVDYRLQAPTVFMPNLYKCL